MATILCVLAAAAAMQERVTLKHQPKAGDSITLNATFTMSVKVTQDGKELDYKAVNNRLATTEIAEVADGRTTKKIVEILSDTDEHCAEGRTEKRENPLHGRKVTALRKNGKWTFECNDKVDAEALKKAGDEEKYTHLLPGREVAVGESWTLSGDKLKEAWGDGLEGEMKMTLKELKDVDGKRCAVVAVKWDVRSPKEADGTEKSVKFEGELIATVDRGYVLSLMGSGPIVIKNGEKQVATGTVNYLFVQSVTAK